MSLAQLFYARSTSGQYRRFSRRRRPLPARHRAVLFESLEPRLLLSATPVLPLIGGADAVIEPVDFSISTPIDPQAGATPRARVGDLAILRRHRARRWRVRF